MKYGHFDDKAREYVITTPRTPYPWINYLGSESFFSLMSNTCGGYSFYKDARLRRLTRYRYNNVPLDSNGKYFYIKDGDTVWNPGWQPVQTELDSYECRHGFGYTRLLSSKNGLSADALFFVPVNYNVEVQQLKIKNDSHEVKDVSVYSFVEWCLYNAQDDGTNFQRNFSTGEVEIEGSAIYHKTEYRERRNHYAFYSVNTQIDGFETDRESFTGTYNGLDCPDAVMSGKSRNSVADGWSPVASHRIDARLNPGEERTYIFVLGYIENADEEKWQDAPSKVPFNASHLVERKAHKSALLGYGLQNALANPPYGVRDKLKASGFIKLLCGFDKPHISFVDKIRQAEPLVLVLFGNRHHETEIGFC